MKFRRWTLIERTVRGTALTIAVLLVTAAQAQEKPKESPHKIATRLVRQLEEWLHPDVAVSRRSIRANC